MNKTFGIIGLILVIIGLVLAIKYNSSYWYSYYVIGGTLFVGFLNFTRNKKSFFYNFKNRRGKLLMIYISFLLSTIIIEIVGRFFLKLWYYPNFDSFDKIVNVFLIGYPFALFFVYETYVLIGDYIKNRISLIFSVTLISAFIHELPNLFAYEWIYTIPYINFSIFSINVVVILGWIILVIIPLIINHLWCTDKKLLNTHHMMVVK